MSAGIVKEPAEAIAADLPDYTVTADEVRAALRNVCDLPPVACAVCEGSRAAGLCQRHEADVMACWPHGGAA